jgi:phage shock protein PspC (stress-responsive transcriptional regulator)
VTALRERQDRVMEQPTPPPPAQPPTSPPTFEQPFSAPPPLPPTAATARSDGFFEAMRRIGVVRTPDRWIGGVAGGIAQRFGVDPLLVRGLFGVTVLFGGLGLVLYGLGWALLPEQVDGRIHLQETIHGQFHVGLLGAIALFLLGVGSGNASSGRWDNNGFGWLTGLLWLAALVALVVLVIATRKNRRARRPAAGTPGPGWTGPGASYQDPAAPTFPAAAGSYRYAAAGSYPAPTHAPAGKYVPVPPVVRRQPKTRVGGPGAGAIGAVVGLSLLALAVLLIAQRQGSLAWSVPLAGAGIAIVLAGAGIIVTGLRGRSSGTLGFLAIVGVALAVPAALFANLSWSDSSSNLQVMSRSGAWVPTSAAQAREGVALAVGNLSVDLTGLPVDGPVVRVPIKLGAGDLTVTVPKATPVSADIRLAAGGLSWEVGPKQQIASVTGSRTYDFASTEVTQGASPALVLQVEAGAGQIRVLEENS